MPEKAGTRPAGRKYSESGERDGSVAEGSVKTSDATEHYRPGWTL